MRQRTKIREHIELHVGGLMFWRHASHWNDQAPTLNAQRKEARERAKATGGKVVRVTRYRLAPLVVLPAWEKRGGSWVTQLGEVHGTYYERDGRWIATAASVDWCRGAEFTEHATIDEARAACERRLRELGFRVARKVGGK